MYVFSFVVQVIKKYSLELMFPYFTIKHGPRARYGRPVFETVCLYLRTVYKIKIDINICLLWYLINALQADCRIMFCIGFSRVG